MAGALKLLIDCSSLVLGGAIQAGLALLSYAVKDRRLSVHVASSPQFWAEVPLDVRDALASALVNRTSNPLGRLPFSFRVERYERTLKPSATYTVFGPSYWSPEAPRLQGFALPHLIYPEVRPFRGWRPLLTARQHIDRGLKSWILRRSRNDWFVVETNTVKHRLARVLPIAEERIFVVGNTVSPFFRNARTLHAHRPKRKELNILVPASYYPHKNLEFVPEVAQRLQRLMSLRFTFTFCLPPDSKGWRQVRRKARLMGVDRLIRAVGQVPHTKFHQLYADADAVFLPTLLECSSAVYPESFSAGVPLVTTDADFSRELCGEAALYCSPTDARQAAELLSRALTEVQTREAMVTLGRERLSRHYLTPEMKWKAQLGLLYDLLNKSSR